ncbi:hypothetical protein JMJ35_010601 [Cladonia borealis]|uniref:Uncharacterized protein n=1 Tax=Cladonia borealis TaxID=184061 RepID=A0AA39QS48_9LECA|nr:hypothetical protein JMJ35_010601 [Cladonia borealis]
MKFQLLASPPSSPCSALTSLAPTVPLLPLQAPYQVAGASPDVPSEGGGGNPPPLPAPATTGSPISTASDAFATSAPSVATLSYSGGVLNTPKPHLLLSPASPASLLLQLQSGRGGGGNAGEPAPPEACHGAKRIKRSDSDVGSNVRIVKRAVEALNSNNPLKDALNNFGDQASAAIDSTEGIMANKFSQDCQNGYVSGLKGHYTPTKTLSVGTGDNAQTFKSGQLIYGEVRFDFDPNKEHVNAQFGKGPSSKFAYQLDQSKWPDGPDDLTRMQKAMVEPINDVNDTCNYDIDLNIAKSTPAWATMEDDAMQKLKDY